MSGELTILFPPVKDPIWDHFVNGKSFQSFVSSYPAFVCRKEVPESIRNKLRVAHKLLIHSYYEYAFLDIAFVRTMQIIEMALRVRYRELENDEPTRHLSLERLIRWADRKGLLEEPEARAQIFRFVRNFAVHAKSETLYGVSIVPTIYGAVDFINELYEIVELRVKRKSIESEVQQALTRVVRDGAILTLNGVRLIVYLAECLYCEIGDDGYVLHIGFMPIFDPRERDGMTDIPAPIFASVNGYILQDDAIDLTSSSSPMIKLAAIADEVNCDKYSQFTLGYKSNPMLGTIERLPFAERRRQIKRSLIRENESRRP
jgi:hypothetical protein